MSDGGKGSARRPQQVADAEVQARWDAIFKKGTEHEQKNTQSDGKAQADSTPTKASERPVSD